MDDETKKLIDRINMNQAPCYGQTAEEVEKWLRKNVQVGAQVIVRHGQGGIIQYIKAKVIRLGRGRFEVDSIGEQSLSPASNNFYYSGKNCWHPKGQTRLVAATEKVLEATAGDGIYEHRYASTTV